MNKIKLIIFVIFIILTSTLITAQEDEILTPGDPCDKSGNAYDSIYCDIIKNEIENNTKIESQEENKFEANFSEKLKEKSSNTPTHPILYAGILIALLFIIYIIIKIIKIKKQNP